MTRVVGIIQARMQSSRLPSKAMLALGGEPAIQHVVKRAIEIDGIDNLVLATSTNPEDDVLQQWGEDFGLVVYRGSERDVVGRLLEANEIYQGTHIARITGDCPLLDPNVCSTVIEKGLTGETDFASNYCPPTFPDGLDFSLIRTETLAKLASGGLSNFDSEHVTTVIERNLDCFRTANVSCEVDLSSYRWTLDDSEDYEFLHRLASLLRDTNSGLDYQSTLHVIETHPELHNRQPRNRRNYGHLQSKSQ